jgi:hypothetical protein
VEDSYVHDLYEGSSGHGDGVQVSLPAAGIEIRHNTIFAPGATSAVNWTGQTQSMLVENNFLGGGAYTLYCPRVTVPTGAFQAVGNRFADGMEAFGLADDCAGGDVIFSGNFRDSDGSPVTP